MSREKKSTQAFHRMLMERFPRAFPKNYDDLLPLKLDIDADIRERLLQQGEPVDPDLLRRVLANHTGRAGYLLALIHRRDGRRYDLDGHPVGEVDALARSEARRLLDEHQRRQQEASHRHRQHQALEKQLQRAKAKRIAERERRAAEKQRRREENERNRLRNLEQKAAAEQVREAAKQGKRPPPKVLYRKRRRYPQKQDPTS